MEERKYFVLVYDRQRGKILRVHEFELAERDQALVEREREILATRTSPSVEVVLLGAESLQDLKTTHARYFQSLTDIATESAALKR